MLLRGWCMHVTGNVVVSSTASSPGRYSCKTNQPIKVIIIHSVHETLLSRLVVRRNSHGASEVFGFRYLCVFVRERKDLFISQLTPRVHFWGPSQSSYKYKWICIGKECIYFQGVHPSEQPYVQHLHGALDGDGLLHDQPTCSHPLPRQRVCSQCCLYYCHIGCLCIRTHCHCGIPCTQSGEDFIQTMTAVKKNFISSCVVIDFSLWIHAIFKHWWLSVEHCWCVTVSKI